MHESFWAGFEKAASPADEQMQEDVQPSATKRISPLAAGAATGTGVTGYHLARTHLMDRAEDRAVKHTGYWDQLQKKMQPGDIVFTRAHNKNTNKVSVGGGKMPFSVKSLVQGMTGSQNYHGGVYLGGGRIGQAFGEGTKNNTSWMIGEMPDQDVKIYRPTAASAAERKRAVKFVERARGTPYPKIGPLAAQGAGALLGVGGSSKNCKVGPEGHLSCTTTVTHAYPDQFKRYNMTPEEMRRVKGMKLVARHRGLRATGLSDRLLPKVLPVVRGLKWGVGAAAAAAGANAIRNRMAAGKQTNAPVAAPAPATA
jgi:hypothetical protein